MARPVGLEALAAREVDQDRPTVETLTAIIRGLKSIVPLPTLAAQLKMEPEEVLRTITGLGTWLIRAHGAAPGAIVYASQQRQLSFFQATPGTIVIPLGYDQGARDTSRSIRAILVHDPDASELSRYIDRQFNVDAQVLTGQEVLDVWTVAALGLLDRLQHGSSSPRWAGVMLEAYDLLDVSLTDAHRAARQIAAADPTDVETVQDALTKLIWLDEPRLRRLSDLLDACRGDASDAAVLVVEREVTMLAREIQSRPRWLAADIAHLSISQVKSLVARNDLAHDPGTRRIELDVRRRLADMDLQRDFDLLVPDGVRATAMGGADVFWTAVEARIAGDPEWRQPLADLLDAEPV